MQNCIISRLVLWAFDLVEWVCVLYFYLQICWLWDFRTSRFVWNCQMISIWKTLWEHHSLAWSHHFSGLELSILSFICLLADVPTVILDENLRTFTTQVSAGNSIELKCDIRGGSDIEWHRNGIVIREESTPAMKVGRVLWLVNFNCLYTEYFCGNSEIYLYFF